MLGNFEGVENSVLPSHNGNLQVNLSPKNELPDESFYNILKIYANVVDRRSKEESVSNYHVRNSFIGKIVDPTIEELLAHRDKLLQSSLNHCCHDIDMNNLDGIMEAFRLYSSLTDS